jgi:hypothetical protein
VSPKGATGVGRGQGERAEGDGGYGEVRKGMSEAGCGGHAGLLTEVVPVQVVTVHYFGGSMPVREIVAGGDAPYNLGTLVVSVRFSG